MEEPADLSNEASTMHNIDSDSPDVSDRNDLFPV